MGLFDFFRTPNFHQGLAEYEATPGAVLLDVRTASEYRDGHVPGSRNLPLDALAGVTGIIKDKATPLFVHCHSGARSHQAAAYLTRLGYTRVKNIGGIAAYTGKLER